MLYQCHNNMEVWKEILIRDFVLFLVAVIIAIVWIIYEIKKEDV